MSSTRSSLLRRLLATTVRAVTTSTNSPRPVPREKVAAREWGKVIHHRDGQVILDPIL